MTAVSDYSERMVTTYKATCRYNKIDHNLNYPRLKGYGGLEDVGNEADIFFRKGKEYERIK
jgi:hypothetical protein